MVAEGYKETEIGVIPEDWKVAELRDIGKVSMCKRIMKNETTDYGKIPFYKIGTFGKEADAYISEKVYEDYKNKYSFPKQGDILISASGTIGRLVVYNGEPAYFQDSNIVWVDNQEDKLLNSLLFYIYKTVKWNTDGNTIARLYNENLRRIKIPLPPLKEQEKIADILSTADEKIDAIASQIEKAETLKKGLLQKLLSEGIGHSEFKDSELGKIPESWEVSKLENLTTKIGDGLHGTPKYVEQSDYYFINGNNLNGKSIEITENTKCVSEEEYTKNKKILDDTTVLLSINGTIGSLAYYSNETVMLGKSVAYMNTNNKISKQFLFYLLKSSHILDYFMLELTGTTIKNLSLKTIRNTKIPLPPLEEQKQIADILSTADEKLEVLHAKKEKYETLKKGLLQKLLSGEVRV
ncbi:MAG: restriction endonuclease subunit S [Sulfurimonas sp.]